MSPRMPDRARNPYLWRAMFDADSKRIADNIARDAERQRLARFSKYGITEAEFNAMFARQAGRCAICRRVEYLVIDHDHATGRVRGLLCGRCNTGLGSFRDDVGTLAFAMTYLDPSAVLGDPSDWYR